jgi:putative Holliday junction resolvase
MRILAVDPGQKRLGIAISDPTGTLARPWGVVKHTSRPIDAATIAQIASDEGASQIVVGQSLDAEGKPTVEGRRAARLAAAIRTQTKIPVILWDETGSTQTARQTQIELGVPRRKRQGHLDEIAASVILQSFLDAHEQA